MTTSLQQKIFWYIAMTALKDECTQKRGMVVIWYGFGKPNKEYSKSNGRKLLQTMAALPIFLAAGHVCYDNLAIRAFVNFGAMIIENITRVRLRFHFGTEMEAQYNLMTFGIPRVFLPVDPHGNFDMTAHLCWIEAIQKLETEAAEVKSQTTTVVPGLRDVLMGRGKEIEQSHGNLRFRHIIETNHDQYNALTRFERAVFAAGLIRLIKDTGGRFLKHGPAGWTEISDDLARDKVTHAFRNYRSRASKSYQQGVQMQPGRTVTSLKRLRN